MIDNAEKNIFSVTQARKAGEFKTISDVMKTTQAQIEDVSFLSDVTIITDARVLNDDNYSGTSNVSVAPVKSQPVVAPVVQAEPAQVDTNLLNDILMYIEKELWMIKSSLK
mgnify:CR=1 FL=1